MYYTYVLYSEKLDRYYIGTTSDLSDRIAKHNRNHKGFTGKGRPWILMYLENFTLKSDALKRENQLKSWKNKERLITLIQKYKSTVGSEHPD